MLVLLLILLLVIIVPHLILSQNLTGQIDNDSTKGVEIMEKLKHLMVFLENT